MFQAIDWLHLSENHNCLIQLGGHDQMGNIAAGHDLIKRKTGKDAFGLLLPLVTAESGQKFGKSEGNAVWLSKELSSPYDLYQFFIRKTIIYFLYIYLYLPPASCPSSVMYGTQSWKLSLRSLAVFGT